MGLRDCRIGQEEVYWLVSGMETWPSPVQSKFSNYVRHHRWPEKFSIIYEFTSLESRAAIFFSLLLSLWLTVLVPEGFEWRSRNCGYVSVLYSAACGSWQFCRCSDIGVAFYWHLFYSHTKKTIMNTYSPFICSAPASLNTHCPKDCQASDLQKCPSIKQTGN